MVGNIKWIKLTTDMFDNRKIKHLRKLPEGNNIVLIWVMLLTMAGKCNSNGMIFLTENIPYTTKMLADELDFEENTVTLALNSLEQLGMIYTKDEFFAIAGWSEYQNIEGMDKIREQNRIRKQNQRERQKIAIEEKCHVMSRDSHATEIEEEKEKEIEEEKKSVRENTHTIFKRLLPDYSFSDSLKDKMEEWIKYKTERKEPYKEQGMKSLLRQVENNAMKYGDTAVCELIDECMASNWKGIIFDRLKNQKPKEQKRGRLDWLDDITL